MGRGLSNMRLGMTLEIATTLGGITGGVIAILIAPSALAGLFAAMTIVTAVLMARRSEDHSVEETEPQSEDTVGWEEPGTLAGVLLP